MHLFAHKITTIQGIFMESTYIHVKIFVKMFHGSVELSKGELGFGVEKAGGQGNEVRPIA